MTAWRGAGPSRRGWLSGCQLSTQLCAQSRGRLAHGEEARAAPRPRGAAGQSRGPWAPSMLAWGAVPAVPPGSLPDT